MCQARGRHQGSSCEQREASALEIPPQWWRQKVNEWVPDQQGDFRYERGSLGWSGGCRSFPGGRGGGAGGRAWPVGGASEVREVGREGKIRSCTQEY